MTFLSPACQAETAQHECGGWGHGGGRPLKCSCPCHAECSCPPMTVEPHDVEIDGKIVRSEGWVTECVVMYGRCVFCAKMPRRKPFRLPDPLF